MLNYLLDEIFIIDRARLIRMLHELRYFRSLIKINNMILNETTVKIDNKFFFKTIKVSIIENVR